MKTFLNILALAAILSLPLIFQIYKVSGDSMSPAYPAGTVVLVERLTPHLFAPQKGTVLVFNNPHKQGQYEADIKRVSGLPNETVEGMHLGTVDYFVMGDNRAVSQDSRSFGAVQPTDFIGRVVWPMR
ncbi:S26 family signal peptidase [Candidatus Kaiserbacteria bacterium]|nr:S26 family signal peptidase [Candidatus Kaiserbacteria bacterium]